MTEDLKEQLAELKKYVEVQSKLREYLQCEVYCQRMERDTPEEASAVKKERALIWTNYLIQKS